MFLTMEPLKMIWFYYAALAVIVVGDQCLPAEEGTAHNITCSFNVSRIGHDYNLLWTAQVNETYKTTVATCYFSRCDLLPGFKAVVMRNESILTIDHVSRMGPFNASTTWQCEESSKVCNLQVYSRPENVKCEFPPVNSSRDSMPVTCTTDRVYPRVYHQTFISTNKVTFKQIIHKGSCQNSLRNETPVYYGAQCEMSVPLQHFRTGVNYIKVRLVPDVYNGSHLAGRDSEVYEVTLSLNHKGATSIVSSNLYLNIGLGIGIFVTACAAVFLGVTTIIYRRKCRSLEPRPGSQSTKQVSKDIPVGYSAIQKTSVDESEEMYEDVRVSVPPSRLRAQPKPIVMDNIYGNA